MKTPKPVLFHFGRYTSGNKWCTKNLWHKPTNIFVRCIVSCKEYIKFLNKFIFIVKVFGSFISRRFDLTTISNCINLSHLIPIHQKRGKRNWNNCKGIAVMSSISSIYGKGGWPIIYRLEEGLRQSHKGSKRPNMKNCQIKCQMDSLQEKTRIDSYVIRHWKINDTTQINFEETLRCIIIIPLLIFHIICSMIKTEITCNWIFSCIISFATFYLFR